MDYRVTTDLAEMDFESIYEFISESYWAAGIPKAVLFKALQNSLCFALFNGEQQIGFARTITDRATFAYLADVFIHCDHRGQGLSKVMMDRIMGHSDMQGLRRIMLATRDAHGLYAKYGFTGIDDASRLMQVHNPMVYQRFK